MCAHLKDSIQGPVNVSIISNTKQTVPFVIKLRASSGQGMYQKKGLRVYRIATVYSSLWLECA